MVRPMGSEAAVPFDSLRPSSAKTRYKARCNRPNLFGMMAMGWGGGEGGRVLDRQQDCVSAGETRKRKLRASQRNYPVKRNTSGIIGHSLGGCARFDESPSSVHFLLRHLLHLLVHSTGSPSRNNEQYCRGPRISGPTWYQVGLENAPISPPPQCVLLLLFCLVLFDPNSLLSTLNPGILPFNWVLLGFYRFLPVFTGLNWVLPNFTGFYRVLLGFTGFSWVLSGFIGLYWFLPVFSRFYRVLPSLTGLNRVSLGFTGFYRVSLGFTGFTEFC